MEEQEEDEGHKISLDLLEKLQKESECTIQFERAPRERITRSSAAVRDSFACIVWWSAGRSCLDTKNHLDLIDFGVSGHRHFKESDSEGWKDDLSLFETWLASKAMSPSYLPSMQR